MRAAIVMVMLVLAGCGGMSEQQAADVTRGIMARAGHAIPPAAGLRPATPEEAAEIERRWAADEATLAAQREQRLRQALARERMEEARAQAFGIEWQMTRVAMRCDDPEIRRVAYATADLQDAALEQLYRRNPRLARISSAEDQRTIALTYGIRPTRAECRRLLTVMGQSAKRIRDGEL